MVYNVIISGIIGALVGGQNGQEGSGNSRLWYIIVLVALFGLVAIYLNFSDQTLAEAIGVDTAWTTVKDVVSGGFTFIFDPIGYWSTIGTGIGALWRRRITNVVEVVS